MPFHDGAGAGVLPGRWRPGSEVVYEGEAADTDVGPRLNPGPKERRDDRRIEGSAVVEGVQILEPANPAGRQHCFEADLRTVEPARVGIRTDGV